MMVLKEAGSECEAAGREAVEEWRATPHTETGFWVGGAIVGLNKDKQSYYFT